jgi:multiple sugar transport system substrate-binding protein
MSDLREDSFSTGALAEYDDWLAGQLQAPLTLPCLQLDHAADYLMVLDQQVARALDGEVTPQAALDSVAARWNELTSDAGMETQIQAWRMAQGMRA